MSSLDFSKESQLIWKDFVAINFSKDIYQSIPIMAKIYAPEMKSTKSSINFGHVLVDQERHQQFSIRNPSFSSVLWDISIGFKN